jgi:2-polyprenyl-6-methoxyphenol hydroxylase-like FAD-dependent oxidoreductase
VGHDRALVIGGSLGGLFAANMLRTAGWDVEVFERVGDDLASRGAGIGTHEEMFDVMRRFGVEVDERVGVRPAARRCLDRDGRIVREDAIPRVLSSWSLFYRALKDAFPHARYHFGKTLARVENRADSVEAVFADGTRAEGGLLVAADGIRSTVRGQLMPEVQPRYAGYVAWRGILHESQIEPAIRERIFEHYLYCLPEGEMIIAYPVPGPDDDVRRGRRSYNWVWYHPVAERGLESLCTDANGRVHALGIPPPLIRPEAVAGMRALARRVFAPQIAEVIERTPQPFFQAIYDLESPRLVEGRVALLGDAAFVARPHVGMGVTKAALDAQCLADELAAAGDGIAPALQRYDARQRLFGTRVVARARKLGRHLEAQGKPREERTGDELYQDPAIVMREVGARLCEIPELYELVPRTARPAR